MRLQRFAFGFSSMALAFSAPVAAQTVSLTDTVRGAYLPDTANAGGGSGTATGNFLVSAGAQHDYFVFNLSGVSGQVTGASLTFNANHGASLGSPTLTLYDYTGSVSALTSGSGSAQAVYNDLGSGTVYGTYVDVPTTGTPFTFTLNDAALAALTSGEGKSFAFGGSVDSVPGSSAFRGSFAMATVVLNLTTTAAAVPEPATWAMMLVGFGAIGFAVRRQQRVRGLGRPAAAA